MANSLRSRFRRGLDLHGNDPYSDDLHSDIHSVEDNYLIIAAIDFGTTYSGYAFSQVKPDCTEMKVKLTEILMNKNWGSELSCTSYKAPTCVLTGPDGKFKSFGYQAENDYNSMTGNKGGYNLYRHFKMLLREQIKINENTQIKSSTGHSRNAVEVFAMALKYLQGHLIEAISNTKVSSVKNSNIKWVLTVPAIWRDSAKHFMRQAAFKAGLIPDVHSTQLVIALEPEAASVYCRNVQVDNFKDVHGALKFKTGQKYLVVDAGGGTLDITAHEILDSGDVKEIYPPSGGPWGGTRVDIAFESLMAQIFGEEFICMYKQNESRDWLMLMKAFERSKAGVSGEMKCNIHLSWKFGSEYGKFQKEDMEESIKNKSHLGVAFRNGALEISNETAIGLFEEVIDNITRHLADIFGDKPLDYVMLVGGFGECYLVQNAVKKVFGNKANVLIPIEAQLAIVKGAVMYASQPSNIHSRIAKYSYGYDVTRPFRPGDDSRYKDIFGGRVLCTDLFKPIIEKGDEVKLNTSIEHRVGSESLEITEVEFYCSDRKNVKHTRDAGVTKLGILTVNHGNRAFGRKTIVIKTTFGGTELFIKARDAESGQWFNTTISYLN